MRSIDHGRQNIFRLRPGGDEDHMFPRPFLSSATVIPSTASLKNLRPATLAATKTRTGFERGLRRGRTHLGCRKFSACGAAELQSSGSPRDFFPSSASNLIVFFQKFEGLRRP